MANFTIGEIDCEIVYERSEEGIVSESPSVTVQYVVAWTDLLNFIKSLKGYWSELGGTWSYTAPHEHPTFTGWFVLDLEFQPLGLPSVTAGVLSFEYALVVARYGPLGYDPTSGNVEAIVHEDLDFSTEIVTVPPFESMSASGDIMMMKGSTIIVPLVSYILTLDAVPELPGGDASLILSMIGKINSETFRGAEAKKILFEGVRTKRSAAKIPALDQSWYSIEFRFTYRPIEWDKLYMIGGWVQAKDASSGQPFYEQADFNQLMPGAAQPDP